MINFNENHIFSNYIKQLLKTFNLPHYNNGNWANDIPNYNYNQKIKNVTRNLKINSTVYDYHTHEYLGEYLRFIKDYAKINLMPLYNCFSNNLCSSLNIDVITSIEKKQDPNGTEKEIENKTNITTDGNTHKIYMFPVKLNKDYTIAIDSELPVEIWCGMYDKYQITNLTKKINTTEAGVVDLSIDLPSLTYKTYNNLQFNQPILYSNLFIENMVSNTRFNKCITGMPSQTSTETENEYIENENKYTQELLNKYEDSLKMFIKIPVDSTSSIAVLEGNYVANNDYIYDNKNFYRNTNQNIDTPYIRHQNKSIINVEYIDKYDLDFTYITNLQLLRGNTQVSYPFADRLIEYLVGNAITSQETIEDNIKRVQAVLEKNNSSFKEYEKGLWLNKFRPYLYTKMYSSTKINTYRDNHDILGYVDKEVEKYYDYDPDHDDKTDNSISISRVDIYPNIYKDSKK